MNAITCLIETGGEEIPKAEAITIIEQAGDKVVLIVNYDNVDEGAPSRHEINLKR